MLSQIASSRLVIVYILLQIAAGCKASNTRGESEANERREREEIKKVYREDFAETGGFIYRHSEDWNVCSYHFAADRPRENVEALCPGYRRGDGVVIRAQIDRRSNV